jgi:hypothetical protein
MVNRFLCATVVLAAIADCKSEECNCPADGCNNCSSAFNSLAHKAADGRVGRCALSRARR